MKTLLLFLGVVCGTVSGNLVLKYAALRLPAEATIIERLFYPYTILGLLLFGSGVLFYITALGSLTLSKAQSYAAAQFVVTVLASFVVFRDEISAAQWVGMTLIAVGIVLVGVR